MYAVAPAAFVHSRSTREDDTERLLRKAAAADHEARASLRERAVLLNLSLAHGLAGTFANRGIEREDLEQVAMVGLCKAVRGYRPADGHSFNAYAVPTVLGELRRHFRDAGWLVRPRRADQELGRAVRAVETELAQSLSRMPTLEEVAAWLGCSAAAVTRAVTAQEGFRGVSLDAADADGAQEWAVTDPGDDFARIDDRLLLLGLLATLSSRERLILRLRFEHDLTQAEIGRRIGVSQMQISRIITGVLARLRALCEDAEGVEA